MSWETKSGPAFDKAADGDPRPIFKTEQGRQEAEAISIKADAIIQRREQSLDQNRNAWVARGAMKVAESRNHLSHDEGPPPPVGATKMTPFQEAELKFAGYRGKVSQRVEAVKETMLEREPGANRIRDFEAITRVQPQEKMVEKDQSHGDWWTRQPLPQGAEKSVADREWWASREKQPDRDQSDKTVEQHKMRDIGAERER